MRVTRGFVVKWLALTAAALVLGTSLGAFYALEIRDDGADGLDAAAGPPDPRMEEDRTPPTTPVLRAPDDAGVAPTTPTFRWEASEDALPVLYVLQFGADPAFVGGDISVRNLWATEWRTPEDQAFMPGVPVFWRVKAVDFAGNESPWSEVRKFVPATAEASWAAGGSAALG